MIVTIESPAQPESTKGLFFPTDTTANANIPVEKLQRNMTAITEAFLETLADIKKVGRFRLTEITVEVEVSAEGGIALIGTAKAAGKGAISLKFEG